jgi:MFS family permease
LQDNPVSSGGARSQRRAWLVWSLAASAFGYAFFQRVMPGAMADDLMRDFAIGGALLGTLSALYFYPYVFLQVPLGAMIDQIGARILMSGALSIAAVGSVLFAISDTLWLAYIGRTLIGIGSAVGFLGSLAIAGKWFPPRRFAFLAGLAMFFAMISGMLGQAPLALFVSEYGWRTSVMATGLFGAGLALLIFAVVRDSPSSTHGANPKLNWKNVGRGLWAAARLLRVWHIALVAMAMSGPMLTIAGLWGTPYLSATYNLSKPEAAFYVSLLLLGWAFGAPFWGWLSDYTGQLKALLVWPALCVTLLLAMVCFVPNLPLWLTVSCFTGVGFFGSCMPITFALGRKVTSPEISGSVTGIINSATVLSGAVLQPAVGYVLDRLWNGVLIDGSRHYQAQDYQTGFILVFAMAAAGFVFALFLKETPAN